MPRHTQTSAARYTRSNHWCLPSNRQMTSTPLRARRPKPATRWSFLVLLAISLAWFGCQQTSDEPELASKVDRLYHGGPAKAARLTKLIGEDWSQVCASTMSFGSALATTPALRSTFQEIEKAEGWSDDATLWRLVVFRATGAEPSLYHFSRRKHPFVDGPLLLKTGQALPGTPVLCTHKKTASLLAVELSTRQRVLSLIETD